MLTGGRDSAPGSVGASAGAQDQEQASKQATNLAQETKDDRLKDNKTKTLKDRCFNRLHALTIDEFIHMARVRGVLN